MPIDLEASECHPERSEGSRLPEPQPNFLISAYHVEEHPHHNESQILNLSE